MWYAILWLLFANMSVRTNIGDWYTRKNYVNHLSQETKFEICDCIYNRPIFQPQLRITISHAVYLHLYDICPWREFTTVRKNVCVFRTDTSKFGVARTKTSENFHRKVGLKEASYYVSRFLARIWSWFRTVAEELFQRGCATPTPLKKFLCRSRANRFFYIFLSFDINFNFELQY